MTVSVLALFPFPRLQPSMFSFTHSIPINTVTATTVTSTSKCSASKQTSPTKRRRAAPAQIPGRDPTNPISTACTKLPANLSVTQQIALLEAGGYWDVKVARGIVEAAAASNDCALAVRALVAFESAGFFSPRSLSTCVLNLLSTCGLVSECYNFIERLYEPHIMRKGGRFVDLDYWIYAKRKPNPRMVTVAANCAVRMARIDVALDMVELMKKCGDLPNSYIYCVLIKGLGRTRQLDALTRTFKEAIISINPEMPLFNVTVDAYTRCNHWKFACETIAIAEKFGLTLEPNTFNPLLRECARLGKLAQAEEIISNMKEKGVKPSITTLNTLMQTAIRANRLDIAENVLQNITNINTGVCGVNATQDAMFAYSTMISGLASQGKISEASNLLNEMMQNIKDVQLVSPTLAATITTLLRQGNVAEGWKLFRELRKFKLGAEVYRAVIRGLAAHENVTCVKSSVSVLTEMMAIFCVNPTLGDTAGNSGDTTAYELCAAHNAVIYGLVRIGEPEKAEEILQQMIDLDIGPSTASYTAVLTGYARCGSMENAERILADIRAIGLVEDLAAANALLEGYAASGQLEPAEALFVRMTVQSVQPTADEDSYAALITNYIKNKRVHVACELYEEMKDLGLIPSETLIDSIVSVAFLPEYYEEKYTRKLLVDMERCNCSKKLAERWKSIRLTVPA